MMHLSSWVLYFLTNSLPVKNFVSIVRKCSFTPFHLYVLLRVVCFFFFFSPFFLFIYLFLAVEEGQLGKWHPCRTDSANCALPQPLNIEISCQTCLWISVPYEVLLFTVLYHLFFFFLVDYCSVLSTLALSQMSFVQWMVLEWKCVWCMYYESQMVGEKERGSVYVCVITTI